MQSKNTCEGVHLIVKLPTVSLQASKFTKNELLHTFFKGLSQILSYYIVCFFQESFHGRVLHFSVRGFAFQMGGFFSKWGSIDFDGGRFSKKVVGQGGAPPLHAPTPLWENLWFTFSMRIMNIADGKFCAIFMNCLLHLKKETQM